MRKIKEVLRLRNELKLDQRQIARSCSMSVSTVHEYLKRTEAATVGWPLPEGWDDARLEAALFPPSGSGYREFDLRGNGTEVVLPDADSAEWRKRY
jgi:hypothetical protein